MIGVGMGTQSGSVPRGETKAAGLMPELKGHGKMVVLLTNGLEDLGSMNKDITAKPPQAATATKKAKRVGIRLIPCGESLKWFDIPSEKPVPGVDEVEPTLILRLAESVSNDNQVIK